MRYEEAIDWLASHDPPVLNKEGQPHVFGMDIEEGTSCACHNTKILQPQRGSWLIRLASPLSLLTSPAQSKHSTCNLTHSIPG